MSGGDARIIEKLKRDHAAALAELDQIDRRRAMVLAQVRYIGTLLGLTEQEARDGDR